MGVRKEMKMYQEQRKRKDRGGGEKDKVDGYNCRGERQRNKRDTGNQRRQRKRLLRKRERKRRLSKKEKK